MTTEPIHSSAITCDHIAATHSAGLEESEQLFGGDRRHKWSIPDRMIAMKYLIAVKGGMEPRQWAQLHPAEWKRLVEIAPLKRGDSQPTR